MDEHVGPIYEETLTVDAEAAGGLDEWLAAHVDAMLELPGFVDAETSELDDESGRVARVTRYFLASDEALEAYLAGPAGTMRAETEARFGASVDARRRVLRDCAHAAAKRERCLNCQSPLTGQYCGNCGQRAQSRLISVWELVRDALGDVLDVDSRLWRTLGLLAARPGLLTYQYLRGRRARFMPPFRTYLVLSLLFFAVAFFDPRENLGILFEPAAESEGVTEPADAAARRDVLDELAEEGIIVGPGWPTQSAVSRDDADAAANSTGQEGAPANGGAGAVGSSAADAASADAQPGEFDPFDPEVRVSLGGNEIDGSCDLGDYDPAELPAWLGRRLTRERVQQACDRMTAEDGSGLRGFADKLLESVPVGLIILLPLMALVLKVLYPLSRRYYVEHLLLVVHFHAFVFLALIVQTLLSRGIDAVSPGDAIEALVLLPIPIYIPVYLYKSLRRVYRQGHILTSLKFLLLSLTYTVGLTVLLVAMALIAAFSV